MYVCVYECVWEAEEKERRLVENLEFFYYCCGKKIKVIEKIDYLGLAKRIHGRGDK